MKEYKQYKVRTETSVLTYDVYDSGDALLDRCYPLDGFYLYEIKATYAKSKPATSYYVLGSSAKDAKRRLLQVCPWLYVVCLRMITGEEADEILSDPLRMPLR